MRPSRWSPGAHPKLARATSTPPVGQSHTLSLTVTHATWIKVVDRNGQAVVSTLLHAGEQRTIHSTTALQVTLGDANGITVELDGQPHPVAASPHSNVVRFLAFPPAVTTTAQQ